MQTINGLGDQEINALIFDMDNTLFDFVEAKLKACKAVVNFIDLNDEIELLEYFLKDIKDIENPQCIARYLRDKDSYSEETYIECSKLYEAVKIDSIQVYDGVIETLDKLHKTDLKLALVTDASTEKAMERLDKTKLKKYFDIIVTFDTTGKKKPEPDSILFAIKELDVTNNQTVLIGDSLARDIKPAKKLGLLTIYAAYGDRNYMENRIHKADFVIQKISEILSILGIQTDRNYMENRIHKADFVIQKISEILSILGIQTVDQ
jgi:putative hydrolase of the HAD superfamily